jgi:hypothetical protein
MKHCDLPWEDDVEPAGQGLKLLAQIADALDSVIADNERLRRESAEGRHYRKQFMDLLHRDIAHNEHMLGGLLQLALKPGVMEAIGKSNLPGTAEPA